jgi:oligosaccharide repeat unit polymerase
VASRPPPVRRVATPPVAPALDPDAPIGPHWRGTCFALFGLFFTSLTLHGWRPSDIAAYAAVCVAVSLAVSIFFDFRRGFRNLQRADLFAILSYYFLTLFEFLFPQRNFDKMLSPESASAGVQVCLLGFAGLLLGRHLIRPKRQPFQTTLTHEFPRAWLLAIFFLSLIIGYGNMLAAVNGNFFEMINFFMAPRFTQPWTRERLGNWSSLLYELNMLIQLIPPLAGIILARRHRYPVYQLILVAAGLALTLFYGFSGGTRNLLATFLVTFLIGYSLALPPNRNRELTVLATVCALTMCFSTFFMLQFRDVGLKDYMSGKWVPPAIETGDKKTLFVDYNLFSICKLMEFFPRSHDFLGWEIPFQALIRPIPRAIWPDKPTGLSMSIEDALNVEGLTISASFAGEAYMSGGYVAVFLIALALGAFTGWWCSLASPRNSEVGHLVYASGFLAAVISMRSLFVFTTALLPTLAAIVISTFAVQILVRHAAKLFRRARPVQRPPLPPQPLRRT